MALFAISYDSVETLAAFAEKHGIAYPLLSDTGSRVIRELGLLNEHVFEQYAAYNVAPRDEHYGVPYPGVFVLDEAGVVVDKRFQQSYRERETGGGLLEHALGIVTPMHGAEAQASAEAVQVRAYLDSPTYGWFQRLRLTVELTIEPGFHVYGQPVPEGFIPLAVEIEPIEGLQIGEPQWPAPHRFVLEGLDEEFWVYEGTVRGSVPLTFTAQPGAGDQVIRATVSFQACTETYCLEPAKLRFELPIEEIALVDRPIQVRQS